jgi:hypothetical protein
MRTHDRKTRPVRTSTPGEAGERHGDGRPSATAPLRVAVLGGDARQRGRWPEYPGARFFAARGDGGNGELRRLLAALRARAFDLVIVLARWNAHAVTGRVRRACRALGVRVEVIP